MASDSKDVYRGPLLDLQPTPLLSVNNVDLSNLILIPTSLVTPFTLSFQKRQKCYFYNLHTWQLKSFQFNTRPRWIGFASFYQLLPCQRSPWCASVTNFALSSLYIVQWMKTPIMIWNKKSKTIEKSRFRMSTTGFFIDQEGYFPRTRSSPQRREIRFFHPEVLFSPPPKLAIQSLML